MRYLHVMSRPKVIDHEHDTVWTEAYVDSAVSTESRKKAFVQQLWLPVFHVDVTLCITAIASLFSSRCWRD